MSKIVKIDGQYFTLDKFTLVELETAPENDDDVVLGDSVSLKVTKAKTLTAAKDAVETYKTKYRAAAEKAAASGKKADGDARVAAAVDVAVANQTYLTRYNVAEAATEELPDTPDPAGTKPADTGDDETPSEPAATGDSTDTSEPGGGTPNPETGQTPETTSEETVLIPDDLSSLNDEEKQLVTAAGALLTRSRGAADQVAAGSSGVSIVEETVFDRSKATQLGDVPRRPANFVVASGIPGATMGATLAGREADELISSAVTRLTQSRNPVPATVIGEYQMIEGNSQLVTADAALDRLRGGRKNLAVTAAGELCDHDERRVLPDCDDVTGDLGGLFETYAAPKCQIRYMKDIGLSDIDEGVYVWDDAAKQAYCDAKEAYNVAIASGEEAAVISALAQIELAQKRCMEANCLEWSDMVTMVSHYTCLQYSIEGAQCNPEHIARHRRKLAQKFLRVSNAYMLAYVASTSVTVNVDANAAPWLMQSGVQLDTKAIYDQVLCELMPQGVMAERVTEGNYVAVVPYGMAKAMGIGNAKACQNLQNDISSATGIDRVIVSKDVAATAADMAPTGPYPNLPEPGTTVDFNDIRLPTDWQIHVFDPDDYFRISRPTIELGAEITHESAKTNDMAAEFLETHVGFGKDGCHPAWTINFLNNCYSGVRVGCDLPVPCAPAEGAGEEAPAEG